MTNNHNAKYAFYYLLSLVALIFTTVSVGMIAYSIIDKTVPDALNSYISNYDGQLKFAISALIIATPIFYIISSLIFKGLRKQELEKDSGVRRWLTYLIILVSSLIILGVFIGMINSLLSGELTSRFVLKAITIFVLAAGVFSFYFYDIKREDLVRKDIVVRLFFYISLALVIIAFIAAFFFVESPKTARARRLDQIVINNISGLESSVNTYYEKNKRLPESIDELKADKNIYLDLNTLTDPDTKQPIIYQKFSEKDFQFCATFRLDSAQTNNDRMPVAVSYPTYPGDKSHGAGYQCLPGSLWSNVKSEPVINPGVN
ncbi:MAG: DUF5671 domain-containing protein [Candidatus Falkowbacteria bacterium]